MKTIFLIFIGLTLLTACNDGKAKLTTINGQVRTFGTEQVIKHPPVKVQILEKYVSSTWGAGTSYNPIAEVWTDENLNFSISHKLYSSEEYYLGVDGATVKEKYFYASPENFDQSWNLITQIGGTQSKNYYLSAYGWVNFHFISENPLQGDEFWYSVGGGGYEDAQLERMYRSANRGFFGNRIKG